MRPADENIGPGAADSGGGRMLRQSGVRAAPKPHSPEGYARESTSSPHTTISGRPSDGAQSERTTVAAGPVLVIGGIGRYSLAVVRALGRCGIPVVLAAERRRCLAGVSRFVRKVIRCPSPEREPDEFVAAVAAAVREHDIGVVMAISEVALEQLLRDPTRLLPATLPFGPLAAFDVLNDKRALYGLARELQVPVPRTVVVERGYATAELLPAIGEVGGYPVVMKPYRSRIPVDGRYMKGAVRYAGSEAELVALAKNDPVFRNHPFLVQEKIEGSGAGVFLLTEKGEARACFGHRRLREYPPTGGVSVLAEGVIPDEAMRTAAQALLRRTGWSGVSMVEFKVDRCGTPYLMEVNARFWGTLQLAVDSGINFPAQLYGLAAGLELPPGNLRPNRRNHWFIGDMASLGLTLRSDVPLAQKLRAVREVIEATLDPRNSSAVFQWDDPLPGGLELWSQLKGVAGSR